MDPSPSGEHVAALVERALGLPALARQRERVTRLVADYQRMLAAEERFVAIALVGATGAGKSTLLNALAGQRIAEEGTERPTSRGVTVFAPEEASVARFEAAGAQTRRYSLRAGLPWLGQLFIDTPDLNSVAREHQVQARRALELADVAVVVMHRGSVAEAVQAEFLSEFARRRRLLFVLNFADLLSDGAREQLTEQITRLAHERLALAREDVKVFALSAPAAQRVRDAPPGFLSLVEALRELADSEELGGLRAAQAAAVLEELRQAVTAAVRETDEAIAAVAGALEAGLTKVEDALVEDFTTRLAAARGHLGAEIHREAASRFWGPSAWWMRLTPLGVGGLGAASLVARASVPAAMALAAASAALSGAQAELRRGAVERHLTEGGASGELAGWARAALTAARSRAQQRGLSPEQMALEDVDGLLAELEALRGQAWEHAIARAIPEAVAGWWRWARWVLLPLVNLPLLALLGHVGYRVGAAYLSEAYLSSAYFLNALALAVVLSIAGAGLCSVSLAGIGRRVAREARRRFATSLTAFRLAAVDRVARALEGPREAARALGK